MDVQNRGTGEVLLKLLSTVVVDVWVAGSRFVRILLPMICNPTHLPCVLSIDTFHMIFHVKCVSNSEMLARFRVLV